MAPCVANYPTENSRVMLGVGIDGLELHILQGEKRTGEVPLLFFCLSFSFLFFSFKKIPTLSPLFVPLDLFVAGGDAKIFLGEDQKVEIQ